MLTSILFDHNDTVLNNNCSLKHAFAVNTYITIYCIKNANNYVRRFLAISRDER